MIFLLNKFKQLFAKRALNAAQMWLQAGYAADSAYWFIAYPVHLVLQRDTFSLASPVPMPLDEAEAALLTQSLNQHFLQADIQFFWHQSYWFLQLKNNPQIHTVTPQVAVNQDVAQYLPTGAGAKVWAAFQNEVQMLLFTHPVNVAREAKRTPVINSIWCDNGGQIE